MSLTIVADENMPLLAPLFSPLAALRCLPGRQIRAQDVADADALLVRSVTRIDRLWLSELPSSSRLRFVGSATAGVDHIDTAALAERGIAFRHAPGCNADAVAEYVCAVLLASAAQGALDLRRTTVAIVGAGEVGTRLARRLHALGVAHVLHDPPKAEAGDPRAFVDRAAVLAAEVISFHVPLTRSGAHPTWHWLDAAAFRDTHARLVINAARGPVVENAAACAWRQADTGRRLALDVFEAEPVVSDAVLAAADWVSPHVAGYSLEGKLNGSFMMLDAVAKYFGLTTDHAQALRLSRAALPQHLLGLEEREVLKQLLLQQVPLAADDQRLRAAMAGQDEAQRALRFDQLRKDYPERRELSAFFLPPTTTGALLAAFGLKPA